MFNKKFMYSLSLGALGYFIYSGIKNNSQTNTDIVENNFITPKQKIYKNKKFQSSENFSNEDIKITTNELKEQLINMERQMNVLNNKLNTFEM